MKIHKATFLYISEAKYHYIFACIFGIISTILTILIYDNLSWILAQFLHNKHSIAYFQKTILALLAWIIAKIICNLIIESLLLKATDIIKTKIRKTLLAQNEIRNDSDILYTSGIDALDAYFKNYLFSWASMIFVPICLGIAVFSVDYISGIILLITAPLLPVFLQLVGSQVKKIAESHWFSYKLLVNKFYDIIAGLETPKAFSQSQIQRVVLQKNEEELAKKTVKILKISFLSAFILELVATLSVAIIAVFCGLRLLTDAITFEIAMFVLLLTPEFFSAIKQLGANFHAATNSFIILDNLSLLNEEKYSIKSAEIPPNEKQKPDFKANTLEIVNLSLLLEPNHSIFSAINFYANFGDIVAITGEIGRGKTSLLKVMLQLKEQSSGEILFQGNEIKKIGLTNWRQLIAWCPQKLNFISGTIKENLLLANSAATENDLAEALKFACLDNFVNLLPQKMDTNIGENAFKLSMGEKQRLALARVKLANKNLLFLDEPTAHIDADLETKILKNIKDYASSRIIIIVTHREITKKICCREVVLV